MPTIHREAGFRFFFFPNDHPPAHVHVEYGGSAARFELNPVRRTSADGMKASDLARAELMVREQAQAFEDRWHGYFGTAGPPTRDR